MRSAAAGAGARLWRQGRLLASSLTCWLETPQSPLQVLKQLQRTFATEAAVAAGEQLAAVEQPQAEAGAGSGKHVLCMLDGSLNSFTSLSWAVDNLVDPEDEVYLLTVRHLAGGVLSPGGHACRRHTSSRCVFSQLACTPWRQRPCSALEPLPFAAAPLSPNGRPCVCPGPCPASLRVPAAPQAIPYQDYQGDAERILQEGYDFAHNAGVRWMVGRAPRAT